MSEKDLLASDKERIEDVTNTFADETGQADDPTDVRQLFRWSEQCLAARLLPYIWEQKTAKAQKPWRYITTFSTQEGGTTGDFLNKLHMKDGDGGSNGFVNLTTFERAQLLWSFELWKVTYDTDPPIDDHVPGTPIKYTHKEDIPLIFEKMAKEDLESNGTYKVHTRGGSKTEEYFGRPQTGYGLKSFEWSYIGGDPATVRNDIEATMVVEFQNFNQLSTIRSHTPAPTEDIPTPDPINYSLLDLLGYGPESPRKKEGNEDRYDPSLFEIKAVVGWNVFGGAPNALKNKAKGQKTTLFLTLTEHDFSISQVGTFTLTLKYRARLEAEVSRLNSNVIFATGVPEYSNSGEGIRDDDLGLVQIDAKIAEERCNPERVQYWEEKRRNKAEVAKYKSWQNFYSSEVLYNYWNNWEDTHKTRVAQNEILKERGINLTGEKYGINSATNELSKVHKKIFKYQISRESIVNWLNGLDSKSIYSAADQIQNISNSDTDIEKELDQYGQPDDAGDLDREYNFKKGGGTAGLYTMYFFLLGDLLEIMTARALSGEHFGGTKISPDNSNFTTGDKIKIISGPLEFKVDKRASSDSTAQTTTVRCSLADLPITVEAFSDFWTRNVIEQSRKSYNLLEFIRDIGDQLINKAFGEGCARALTGASLAGINGMTRMKTGFLSLPGNEKGHDPLLYLGDDANKSGIYHPITGDILVENVLSSEIIKPEDSSKTAGDMYNYIVLYVDNIKETDKNKGVEADDEKRGIYHLKIHQGILQSIDFQKTDQPYLKESRQQLNENPMVHLSNTYNVRASTVGNTIFRPGQMVYINPIGFGTSLGKPTDTQSISNIMGLGGYHIIISVTNKVSRDFTTEIVAQWDNNGGKRRDPYSSIASKCAEEASEP
jgi:hypothetical protein